jgi:hypothetical protein
MSFVQAEDERLTQAQNVSDEKVKKAKSTPGGKKELVAAVPTQNQEADSLSINSSVLQVCSISICLLELINVACWAA